QKRFCDCRPSREPPRNHHRTEWSRSDPLRHGGPLGGPGAAGEYSIRHSYFLPIAQTWLFSALFAIFAVHESIVAPTYFRYSPRVPRRNIETSHNSLSSCGAPQIDLRRSPIYHEKEPFERCRRERRESQRSHGTYNENEITIPRVFGFLAFAGGQRSDPR